MIQETQNSTNRTLPLMLAVVALLLPGCTRHWLRKPQPARDPVLSMSNSCGEIVSHLNREGQGLRGWQCGSTKMRIRMPNGLSTTLSGVIACEAPHRFRLMTSSLVAKADLGSNDERCWFYVKPGEPAVMTWKHDDAHLLQYLPGEIPHIDPQWLMLVLGVTPLDERDYQVRPDPMGSPELWLTAIEDTPSGRPLRRVIKVDTIDGVIREHALFDSEANPLVRAVLSDHTMVMGNQLARKVQLIFPQLDTEITLTFKNIEPNPRLSRELWALPSHTVEVKDLGMFVRNYMQQHGRRIPEARPSQLVQEMPQFQPAADFEEPSPFATAELPGDASMVGAMSGLDGPHRAFEEAEAGPEFVPPPKAADWTQPFNGSQSDNGRFEFQRPDNFAPEFDTELEEPDWAEPVSYERPAPPPPPAKPKRRGWFDWFRR